MKILALDTSSIVATVAVMDEGKLIGEYTIHHKRTHSQKLMPMIEELLKNCELTMQDIDVVAVAEGPGSFTGLRIGVATAKGLAHAVNIPVVGISTLDALAMNSAFSHGIICPILDAKRSQVYAGVYKWDHENLHIIEEPMAISIENLVEKLSERPENVLFLGDGIENNKDYLIEKLKKRAVFAPNSVKMPRASSVAQIGLQKAKNKKLQNYYELTPTYLRKSEAERQYEEKMKRCGECED
ncbi:tRNA (adenosine(37)-N6)-threonylcarbamoyltransferase complex dimerization subunit type 1 TsaB [Marinisporobacter balticus]|uniref:tRNA threonylcarbamoyladenosine biosynthesis protein TsaB n=1 Tax=Marinisporobacter balticus TaxID=2018667 RepID=A0A4R2KQ98_9FIRM|nr:tRNA (adenosine(37)-N6)-threonylcarbamoyltransferase complex dimerization subunit type 1 TsaB [Marinisporobacter balticus]TCO76431.1 tRNA threonylcarbamoyladenosine biosynthesis protein TsaB [Marinisporobacter balticus]